MSDDGSVGGGDSSDVGGGDSSDASGGDSSNAGGGDSSDAALIAGIVASQWVTADETREPRKAQPYVEPDYGTVWSRRWRVIRPFLLLLAGAGVVWMMLAATSP